MELINRNVEVPVKMAVPKRRFQSEWACRRTNAYTSAEFHFEELSHPLYHNSSSRRYRHTDLPNTSNQFDMSTTVVEGSKIDTPFLSGALRSGSSIEFWKSYVESRPSPPEQFFEIINKYHHRNGDSRADIVHDVGTGPGNIAARLSPYYRNIVGSDLNEDVLSVAPSLISKELLGRMTFVKSRAEDLVKNTPPQNGGQGTTDTVIVSECMPLLDAPVALKAFHNLLRPGGTLGIHFYGPAVFTDGDVDKCNAAYDRVATRICSFNQPMKGTEGFQFHLRGAEALASYLDNIAFPSEDWEDVERCKWNCDYPLLFNSKEGFDFDFAAVDRRAEGEITKDVIDRDFWATEWDVDDVVAYLDSVYPNYRHKAGSRYSEVDTMIQELRTAMGGAKRKVTFPLVLVLATKKATPASLLNGNHTTKANIVQLNPNRTVLGRVNENPPGSVEMCNHLLQKNHDTFHIFWRDANGHNHMSHSILTTFALGGSPAELQRAYDDGLPIQRPMPDPNAQAIKRFSDDKNIYEAFGQIGEYTNVLLFFEQEINRSGWKAVVSKYCFSRSKLADIILSRMYEGAYHPLIHLGLGIEFEQPSIIAEALAQAIVHDSSGIPDCLRRTDQEAFQSSPQVPRKSMLELFTEARSNDAIREAPYFEDGPYKMRDGVLGRCKTAITSLAAQFHVESSEVYERAAEVINCSAYLAGAAQRVDKSPKIDFFFMHAVTSSIFITVMLNEPWISLQDKARLVEWKGKTDLLWYVAGGCPDLHIEEIIDYKADASAEMGWSEIYRAVNQMHDDGHVAKFIRALKSAEDVSRPYETVKDLEHTLPIKGEAWLKLARMAYDSTVGLPDEAKWVWSVGFEQAWAAVPARAPGSRVSY
jgi:SAM-dependent methyltransferase